MAPDATPVASSLEALYRSDWGRIVAALIRLFGDFDAAEEAAQEAFAAAVNQWPASGVPEFPRAWIIQTARNKAIDRIRRQGRLREKLDSYLVSGSARTSQEPHYDAEEIPDDRLRLIFTCCHPALALDAQVALTLRTLCGLDTDEIARAFLVPGPTMAQRLVRAKRNRETNEVRATQVTGRCLFTIPLIVLGPSTDIATRVGLFEDQRQGALKVTPCVTDRVNPEAGGMHSTAIEHYSAPWQTWKCHDNVKSSSTSGPRGGTTNCYWIRVQLHCQGPAA